MLPITAENIADALADKVGRLGVFAWLAQAAQFLETEINELVPNQPKASHIVEWPHYGLSVTLHHQASAAELTQARSMWIISDVILNSAWGWSWPFELDAGKATPEQAVLLLGKDTSGLDARAVNAGDLRQTFFLSDGRAIGITWKPGLQGFDAMHICRLGLPLDS